MQHRSVTEWRATSESLALEEGGQCSDVCAQLRRNAQTLLALLDTYHEGVSQFNRQLSNESACSPTCFEAEITRVQGHINEQVARFARRYDSVDVWTEVKDETVHAFPPSNSKNLASPLTTPPEPIDIDVQSSAALQSDTDVPFWPRLCNALCLWSAVPDVRDDLHVSAHIVSALRNVTRTDSAKQWFAEYRNLYDLMQLHAGTESDQQQSEQQSMARAVLQQAALTLLFNVCLLEPNKIKLIGSGGLSAIVNTMRAFSQHPEVLLEACAVISSLARGEEAHTRSYAVQRACIVPYVLGAMSRHSHHAALQAEACFCLRSIKLSNHGDRQIVRCGGLKLVFLALHNHKKDVLVQTRAIGALERILRDTTSKLALARDRLFGLRAIVELLQRHSQNKSVMTDIGVFLHAVVSLDAEQRAAADASDDSQALAALQRRFVLGDPAGFYLFSRMPEIPIDSPTLSVERITDQNEPDVTYDEEALAERFRAALQSDTLLARDTKRAAPTPVSVISIASTSKSVANMNSVTEESAAAFDFPSIHVDDTISDTQPAPSQRLVRFETTLSSSLYIGGMPAPHHTPKLIRSTTANASQTNDEFDFPAIAVPSPPALSRSDAAPTLLRPFSAPVFPSQPPTPTGVALNIPRIELPVVETMAPLVRADSTSCLIEPPTPNGHLVDDLADSRPLPNRTVPALPALLCEVSDLEPVVSSQALSVLEIMFQLLDSCTEVNKRQSRLRSSLVWVFTSFVDSPATAFDLVQLGLLPRVLNIIGASPTPSTGASDPNDGQTSDHSVYESESRSVLLSTAGRLLARLADRFPWKWLTWSCRIPLELASDGSVGWSWEINSATREPISAAVVATGSECKPHGASLLSRDFVRRFVGSSQSRQSSGSNPVSAPPLADTESRIVDLGYSPTAFTRYRLCPKLAHEMLNPHRFGTCRPRPNSSVLLQRMVFELTSSLELTSNARELHVPTCLYQSDTADVARPTLGSDPFAVMFHKYDRRRVSFDNAKFAVPICVHCAGCMPRPLLLHLRSLIYVAAGSQVRESVLRGLGRPEDVIKIARLLIMCGATIVPLPGDEPLLFAGLPYPPNRPPPFENLRELYRVVQAQLAAEWCASLDATAATTQSPLMHDVFGLISQYLHSDAGAALPEWRDNDTHSEL